MKSTQRPILTQTLPLAMLAAAGFITALSASASADDLPRMIDIRWTRGPNLPQGLQDSDGGIIDNTLISVGGFQQGGHAPGKDHPRGFVHETWALDLADPAAEWVELPPFPGSNNPENIDGAGRQGMFAIAVKDELYVFGGFNYTAPFTYADGYKLRKNTGDWQWESLPGVDQSSPTLPTPLFASGIAAIGTDIYVVGGADYDAQAIYTHTDRAGGNVGLGKRLLKFDTTRPQAGWTELTPLPGTPRFVHATAAVGNKLYVFGGATGGSTTHTVVDNWVYDTTTAEWTRLADLPASSGNFPEGEIVVNDRVILLIGGYDYGIVEHPDGSTSGSYGQVTRTIPGNPFCSDVWVYDTHTNQFGTATPLPYNNNVPTAVVHGDKLYLLGGETLGFEFEGEHFAHHPDSNIVGAMTVVLDPHPDPSSTKVPAP